YNERIKQMEIVIESFTAATTINAACPEPIDDSYWKNRIAKEAAGELFNTLDTMLSDYNQYYTEWIEILKERISQIESQNIAVFHYQLLKIIGLTGEARDN